MSIIIKNESLEYTLDVYEFNNVNKQFVFKDNGDQLKAQFDYDLDINEMNDISNYDIHLLYNKNFAENNIFQIFDGDTRLGWLFPMQAIISRKHDFAENKHFLNYAYVAFLKLLIESENLKINNLSYREDCNYKLEDLFDIESTHVLITSKANTEQINDYDYQNYIPSLYEKGYLSRYGGNYKEIDCYGKIKLNKVSSDLNQEVFVKYLFNEILVESSHPLVKFYMLYQVIELLIEKIFNYELTILLDGLSKDEKNLFQVKEDLGSLANESERIKKLFNQYSKHNASRNELMNLCNVLLEGIGRDKKNSPEKALYSVRNLYVHDYRSIPIEYKSQIEQINDVFEKVVIETIHTFNLNN